MSTTTDSKQVVKEIEEILKNTGLFDYVSSEATKKLAEETNRSAVYLNVPSIAFTPEKASTLSCGYDRTMFITLDINYTCDSSPLDFLDLTDAVERGLLKDSPLWKYIKDRDIVGIEFDELQFYPKRAATMLLEVSYSLSND